MSGKFSIGNDFNVFDEWGNHIGKFTPSGGGFDGCIMMIGLVLVGIIGYAFYFLIKLLVKMVAEGFKSLGKREWGLAIIYLIPIWIPIVIGVAISISGINNAQQQIQMQQAQLLQAQQELDDINKDFPVYISNVRRVQTDRRQYWECPTGPCYEVDIHYTIENKWGGRISFLENDEGSWPDGTHIIECSNIMRSQPGILPANSVNEIECTDFTVLEDNNGLVVTGGYEKSLDKLCINIELLVEPYTSLYEYSENIKRRICADIPYELVDP